MNNFIISLNAVVPMFLAISWGFGARKLGLVTENEANRINSIGFRLFLPFTVFYSIYKTDLNEFCSARLLVYIACMIFLALGIGLLVSFLVEKKRPSRAVLVQAFFRSNYAMFGLPLARALASDSGIGAAALVMTITIPIYNIASVIILELFRAERVNYKKILLSIIKNPLIIASAAGIFSLLIQVSLPQSIEHFVSDMCDAANPILFFALGASFNIICEKGRTKDLIIGLLAKLVFVPLLAISLGIAIGFRGIEVIVILGVFASSPSVSSYTMSREMGGDAELASNLIVVGSALCCITLFIWTYVLKTFEII